MKQLYFYFAMLIAILSTTSGFSQNNLKGKISNSKDNTGIKNVSVFIPDLQRVAISDEAGNFSFDNLSKAVVNVQFTFVGFKSQVKTVNGSSNKVGG